MQNDVISLNGLGLESASDEQLEKAMKLLEGERERRRSGKKPPTADDADTQAAVAAAAGYTTERLADGSVRARRGDTVLTLAAPGPSRALAPLRKQVADLEADARQRAGSHLNPEVAMSLARSAGWACEPTATGFLARRTELGRGEVVMTWKRTTGRFEKA